MRALVNEAFRPEAVPAPSEDARTFHRALPAYAPTPVHVLAPTSLLPPEALAWLEAERLKPPAISGRPPGVPAPPAAPLLAPGELAGLGAVLLKDESDRFGLPAFKVLGASWAIERALRERPDVDTLVAASAGNHGRAVAHEARRRGLRARVFLPARSIRERREAIAQEGAEVVVVDATYEDAVAQAREAAALPRAMEVADVGETGPARWVVDGYATLFAEAAEQAEFDALLVPVGVGSLAAAAVRFGALAGIPVVGVEPATAACLTASLAAGEPTVVPTPGTTMAGLDCAEVSPAAWPELRDGLRGTVTVTDAEAHSAMYELAAAGLPIGDSGAAPLAALRALVTDPEAAELREVLDLGQHSRVLLVATEGLTSGSAWADIVHRHKPHPQTREQELLADLRAHAARAVESGLDRWFTLEELRLDGQHPGTTLVVRAVERTGRVKEWTHPLWTAEGWNSESGTVKDIRRWLSGAKHDPQRHERWWLEAVQRTVDDMKGPVGLQQRVRIGEARL